MIDPASLTITISITALLISATTAWLTLFRRGTVKMVQPTTIFFGSDSSRDSETTSAPKVYLRTLLFSTSKRGCVIENMYVALSKNETLQNFNIWVYGDHKLVRGSGLFVGETGVSANHHFLTPKSDTSFKFTEGQYKLEVYAHILGNKKRKLLFSQKLEISREIAQDLTDLQTGVYFDWGPDSGRYLTHVDKKPKSAGTEDFLEALMKNQFRA